MSATNAKPVGVVCNSIMTQLKFLLVFLVFALDVSANNNVLIKGTFTSRPFTDIPLTQLGIHYNDRQKLDMVAQVDKSRHFMFAFNIFTAGFYRLGDGLFGHIIFIEPGDTIAITLTPYSEKEIMTGIPFHRSFNKMTVQSKHAREVSFFDEADKVTKYPVKFKLGKETPQQFKNRCDTAVSISYRLLHKYLADGSVTDTFAYYAKAEINAQYILNLCDCLYFIPKNKLSKDFFNNISITNFNDENIARKTDSYLTAISVYNVYVANDFDTHKQDYTNLTGEFDWANKTLSGTIRDRILSWIVDDYKDKGFASYDSVYNVFLMICKTGSLKNETTTKINHYKESKKMQAVSFSDMLDKTKVIDVKGDTLSFADVLSNNNISVIDFWATWCKPCLAAKPDFEKAADKYKEKVDFISISTDSDFEKWKQFRKGKSSAKNYYLIDNFTSPLVLFLKIEMIPRFVSISKEQSKVLDNNMTRPQLVSEFNKIISSYIGKK